MLGWAVADIGAAVAELRGKGVSFRIYEGFGQDADGIWSPPGGGAKVAWFCDPDGNVLSLTQFVRLTDGMSGTVAGEAWPVACLFQCN